ncbi:hypothetical protein Golob_024165 [Gossypium lobatum]|uniref:DUF7745 domain-containing protein n=1 Tax=Gossypium lobatum TaxID=34289 RepID=A0A7J8NFW9_9ROSI|nr:hypothetical protein [Gossypium lobatum]
MENGFLDKVENNAAVQIWFKKMQQEKGDGLKEGYVSKLWDFTCINVTQNNLQELKEIWDQWRSKNFFTIKQKGDGKCIPWENLRDLILAHPDMKKMSDVFTLSIYGLVFFPKALGHIDETDSNLFDPLDKTVTPVPAILAETFKSLNACQRTGEGRFIGCAQLLLTWFHSNFWKIEKVSYRVFFENYSPLKELVATPRRDDISKKSRWRFSKISKRGTSNGEPSG